MRAVVFQGPEEPMEIEEIDHPEPDADGIVVETEACGVCRSDWHAWKGDWDWIGLMMRPGLVFGHEPVGTVVEVGDDVERIREGDRVTNPFNTSDGTCVHCRAGRANICERSVPMGFLDFQQGAYAEEYPVRVADQNAIKVPDGLDSVDVAGLGCRFATAFHGVAHKVDVDPGDWVAVHGCGGVGLVERFDAPRNDATGVGRSARSIVSRRSTADPRATFWSSARERCTGFPATDGRRC